MTLRGSVQDFPLRAVLDLLAQTKKTGELQVREGDRVGALGVADGRVVTAVFGDEEPLLALGAIFGIEAAEFEFTPWDDAPPGDLQGSLDDLLRRSAETRKRIEEEREAARIKAEQEAEAARKHLEELRALIPSDDLAFRLSERAVDQGAVTLTSERWRVVLAVNGERDVNAIAAMLHLEHLAALEALAALVSENVIETVERSAPPPPEPQYGGSAASAPTFDAAPPAAEPEARPFQPEARPFQPEPRPFEPEARPFEPEARPFEPEARPFEPEARPFEPSRNAFARELESAGDGAPQQETATAPEASAATEDWIRPDQAVSAQDWPTPPAETAPISEVAPQWPPASEAPAPAQEWITPAAAEPPAMDDRLSALSGIFGPAPAEPEAQAPAEPPGNAWAPPSADRWSPPPAQEQAPAAAPDDPWGTPPSTAPARDTWTPPASAPMPEKEPWVAPAPPRNTWSAPAAGTTSDDPWGSPAGTDPRTAALSGSGPAAPQVEEWTPPPGGLQEKKKKGLFGFGREKPAPPPVAGAPLPTAGAHGSQVGMLAALSNALIGEYNSGQYGKGHIEGRIANLLMRVDEQADPIDRPLPIVDDRIDVEALERERLAESQAIPYLALLVTTIFADAEKAFGKDKAKKGYKAAQKSVLLGDASALNSPELAGKLPRV